MVQFSLFADDTSILFNNVTHESEEILNNINDWFSANKLLLNLSKTNNITFHTCYNFIQRDIQLETGTISSASIIKFLGLYLDENLKWGHHIIQLNKKISSAVYAIYVINKNVGLEASLTVYFAYFQSLLQYGIEFWGDSTGATATFKIQKKAIRFLCQLGPRESCREHFKNIRIMTLFNLYIYRVAIIVYRNKDKLTKHSDIHKHATRQYNRYCLPPYNYNVTRHSPHFKGIKIFNHLPSEIKTTTSLISFKHKLKSYLLNSVFYSLEEYFTF